MDNKQSSQLHDLDVASLENATADPDIVRPSILQGVTDNEVRRIGINTTLKLDLIIMPAMVTLYILNYLDRQNIAAARLANLVEDFKHEHTAVQHRLIMQVPSNLIVSSTRWPALYMCGAVAVWGVISACTAAVRSYGGLLACRFLLGFVEAVFFPGAFFYLSSFYNQRQMALRTAILFSGSQLGNGLGTLLAIGIVQLDGRYGIAGWRWLFLIEGVVTVGFAFVFAICLPNSTDKIWCLGEREQAWLKHSYESDQRQGDDPTELRAKQAVVLALTDPKTWLMLTSFHAVYITASVINFFPTVVAGLGFSTIASYGLVAPPFLLCVVAMLAVGFHSDRVQERYVHVVLPILVTVVANIIAVATPSIAARYLAIMLLPGSIFSSATVQLSWISGSLSQPTRKRAVAVAFINCVANTANIWSPYMYYSSPRFIVAFVVNLGAAVLVIFSATVTLFYLKAQNRKIALGLDCGKNGPTAAQLAGGFRYML